MASSTAPSPSLSNDAVGSSNTITAGSDNNALANANLCLCPPDSRAPSLPTLNSSPPPSNLERNPSQLAAVSASLTLPSDASGSAYVTFARTVSSNNAGR
mmetsp:Transcript_46919/g.142130  ORF Transcript_46919/g.142130 Transcript_46919/m.142130 type:complete len:100 (-) Transcript_46919:1763-2062(-)